MDAAAPAPRWELYRLLGEPFRLRLLALTATDELSVGELAELLRESQPNVSKHVAALRRAGLLVDRRQGTRVFVQLADGALADPVVSDAVAAGRTLAMRDGSLERVSQVVNARDAAARAYFAQGSPDDQLPLGQLPAELPAYLSALAPLLSRRGLAVDAGTGDGRLLEVLAPLFERVIAVDRSPARLATAAERVRQRGYDHVELIQGEVDDAPIAAAVTARGGADVVFASRMLHHAPKPKDLLAALGALLRPGGTVLVVDYTQHDDERLRDEQADLWLGFASDELVSWGRAAGLENTQVRPLAVGLCGTGTDAHVGWQVLSAQRAVSQPHN